MLVQCLVEERDHQLERYETEEEMGALVLQATPYLSELLSLKMCGWVGNLTVGLTICLSTHREQYSGSKGLLHKYLTLHYSACILATYIYLCPHHTWIDRAGPNAHCIYETVIALSGNLSWSWCYWVTHGYEEVYGGYRTNVASQRQTYFPSDSIQRKKHPDGIFQ